MQEVVDLSEQGIAFILKHVAVKNKSTDLFLSKKLTDFLANYCNRITTGYFHRHCYDVRFSLFSLALHPFGVDQTLKYFVVCDTCFR